ncbi:MAG: hypothetical protein SFU86_01765 [Pirellulaceae bacterium]|nr:hypothetical protein [Pirellulaceae bacterium]
MPSPIPTSEQPPDLPGSPLDASAPPLLDDDWELEADLRSVHRLVESLRSAGRFDPAEISPPARHYQPVPVTPKEIASRESTSAAMPAKSSGWAWVILSLGLATFACGAVLLGWSFATGRSDLWSLGLPLALAGQAGLIVGLVLQLEGLWQSNRRTAETLGALDDELARVRQATTLLSTSKASSGQAFYAHLAEGASPQLLLADLKGQLDLLAQQMASGRR